MATSVQPKIAGLDVLESGLRTLKRSKLLVTREYKDMLCAVERHHSDLRLAHLTGKAKDLLEQAQRDTKFYNILVKMLCEVKEKRSGEQRQGLRKVYTWYLANKHVLYSGPHFGKEHLKKEAHEVLVKATTPRRAQTSNRSGTSQSQVQARVGSATQRNRAQTAPSIRISWRDSSTFDWQKDLEKGMLSQDHPPKVEPLNLQNDDNDDIEPELQRLAGDGDTTHLTNSTPLNTADSTATTNTELLQEARMLSQVHQGSPITLTPLGEHSPNVEVVSSVTPRRMIHPISSMVNPHVTLAVQLEKERQEKLQAQSKLRGKQSRADNLQAWQNFNKNRSYGQDIVDRLNFVGRSGTPNDVRYFTHAQAEMPELFTSEVITGYAQVLEAQRSFKEHGHRHEDHKENVFVQQTLEDFYQTADSLYPTRDAQRPMSRDRVKSAPAAGRKASDSHLSTAEGKPPNVVAGNDHPKYRRASGHPNKLGHILQDYTEQDRELRELKSNKDQDQRTSVKLDTVMNIIDTVSEEMILYKERLAPEAQAGFRQPMATGLPTTTSSPPSVRIPSPVARSNSPIQGQLPTATQHHPSPPQRPYSSPLVHRQARLKEEDEGEDTPTTLSPRRPGDRCKSAGLVDWRGRVQPDTMRYKWSRTKFGGFTYLKKHLQRPISLRSAGSTSAGRRPKTAPMSMREKWRTERLSDANTRVAGQAASHSTTEINQHDVDSMMTVQYLLGSSNSRVGSLTSLFSLDEEFLRSFQRRPNIPSSAPPLEYMSFVSSSPAAFLAERCSKSQNQTRSCAFDDKHLRPESRNQERGDTPVLLPPNLEDLHIPLGLEADIPENDIDENSIAGEVEGDESNLLDEHLQDRRKDEEQREEREKEAEQEHYTGGDAELNEEDRQKQADDVIFTPDNSVKETTHDPAKVLSLDLLPDSPRDVFQSQNTPVPHTGVTSDLDVIFDPVEVSACDLVAGVTPADSENQAPECTYSEPTPALDLEELTPDVIPGHDPVTYATSVSVSTQAAFDTSETTADVVAGGEKEAVKEESLGKGVTHASCVVTPRVNRSQVQFSSTHPHYSQPLSVSQVWQFNPSQNEEEEVIKPGFILGPSKVRTRSAHPVVGRKVICSECVSMAGHGHSHGPMDSTYASTATPLPPRVQRSAGRMPGHVVQHASPASHMLRLSRRHDELIRMAPPPRTPPSIPVTLPRARSTKTQNSPRASGEPLRCGSGGGGGGPVLSELEHHARRVKSPAAFMQHVRDLRSGGGDTHQESPLDSPSHVDALMGTLQVCRLQIPLPRQRTVPLMHSGQEGLHSILKQTGHYQTANTTVIVPTYADEYQDYPPDLTERVQPTMEKVVTFSYALGPEDPSSTANLVPKTIESFANGLQMPESMSFMNQMASGTSSLHSSGSVSRHSSEPSTPRGKNLAHIGRPIAQVANVPDPGDMALAVQKQREAAAAVDIQRIFRGFVARNVYKKLCSEERQRLEDKQRAAVQIQRSYRRHLSQVRATGKRPPNQEMLEWAHNYRQILIANQQQREGKAEERAEQLADNYISAKSKLSVIGPHINIYEIYHPKKTGPSKRELNRVAIAIQRHIRGWLIRRRFDKLHRKAAWYGSTFPKLVKEYKAMLGRVQRQHGVANPKTPFTTREMNDYIDIRRRYESVFEKKAFGGEIELSDIPSFFKECDLYPSQVEIDEALDVAVRIKGGEGRGLKRHEMLDMVFYIYTPPATDLTNTRQSTWMNPIIDGVEAKKLIGAEFVGEAPLEVCAKLVIESRKERRQKEQAAEQAHRDAEEAELLKRTAATRHRISRGEKGKVVEKEEDEKENEEKKEMNKKDQDEVKQENQKGQKEERS